MEKWLLALLISIACALAWSRCKPRPVPVLPPAKPPVAPAYNPVEDQRVDVLYNLTKDQQAKLIAIVKHFCVEKYESPSCIHHLLTCGQPCLVVIPIENRKRIFEDYNNLRRQQGLAPVKNIPHLEEAN